MASLSSISLPKPKDWQAFERNMRELIAAVFNDPNASMNGRNGQPQHGVDIWCQVERAPNYLVGVQCKKKSDGEIISEKELRSEVTKALGFTPPIREFILATTASRDADAQKVARELSLEQSLSDRPLQVSIWAWEDIEDKAAQHAAVWSAFDPTANPFAEQALLAGQHDHHELMNELGSIRTLILERQPQPVINQEPSSLNTPRHGRISAYLELSKSGNTKLAIQELNRLKSNEWATSTVSERYRLAVALASSYLAMGEHSSAGELLLEAAAADPKHANTELNISKGWFLKEQYDHALAASKKALDNHPDNEDAAAILIQARAKIFPSVDPLSGLSDQLKQKTQVLVAYISILRERHDSNWIEIAHRSAEENPLNTYLARYSAEATLETAVLKHRWMVAGEATPPHMLGALRSSAEVLKGQAIEAISNNIDVSPPLAQNASLALRMLGRGLEAIDILDRAIELHPDDESIIVTRAAVAVSQQNPVDARAVLSKARSLSAEGTLLSAQVAVLLNASSDALAILDGMRRAACDNLLWRGVVTTKIECFLEMGDVVKAFDLIDQEAQLDPEQIDYQLQKVRLLRRTNNLEAAKSALAEVLNKITEETPWPQRVEVAHEANEQGAYSTTVSLLEGRLAKDRLSVSSNIYLIASVDGHHLNRAISYLDSLDAELQSEEKVLRARAVIALKTGDPNAENILQVYLQRYPDDIDLVLAMATLWAHQRRYEELKQLTNSLISKGPSYKPEAAMAIAALAIHYGDATAGMTLAYKTVILNWSNLKVRLRYHGLLFPNPNLDGVIPLGTEVDSESAVKLKTAEGTIHQYRLESTSVSGAFSEERIELTHPLAKALLNKRAGEYVSIDGDSGSQAYEILEVKHVWLDALHRSLEEFGVRFPDSNALKKFSFDAEGEDPLREIRKVVQAQVEAGREVLARYQRDALPLAVISTMLGKDPIDTWEGIQNAHETFRVCVGTLPEREACLRLLQTQQKKGCVVDAITLTEIYKYDLIDIIEIVLGPVKTTQSVLDLIFRRVEESRIAREGSQGFIGWDGDQLTMTDIPQDAWDREIERRSAFHAWTLQKIPLVQAIAKSDVEDNGRRFLDMLPRAATDPLIAALGSDLPYLSDDMGMRRVGEQVFHAKTCWLQPVLLTAVSLEKLKSARYQAVVNAMALAGFSYISLDAACLMANAKEGDFETTDDLKALIRLIGGPQCDLASNIVVAAAFIDSLNGRNTDINKVTRIAGLLLDSLSSGRRHLQFEIVNGVLNRLRHKFEIMAEYSGIWLLGHSIGTRDFQRYYRAGHQ